MMFPNTISRFVDTSGRSNRSKIIGDFARQGKDGPQFTKRWAAALRKPTAATELAAGT